MVKREIILIILLLSACTKNLEEVDANLIDKAEEQELIFKIKEGDHYSDHNVAELLLSDTLKFKAYFDSSAIYETQNILDQSDINKLFGMSDCDSHHHENSARFGWRWLNNSIEILIYTYVEGNRYWQYLDTVSLNTWNEYELNLLPEQYLFRVNKKVTKVGRSCSGASTKYLLYPYFGGDETAPHDITIKIMKKQ